MAFGKLYSYMPNPRIAKIQAAAKVNGLALELADDFQFGVTNKTADFLAKFPTGKVPAFEGADGVNLVESDAILQYVAESGPRAQQLLGGDKAERARVAQWVCFQQGDVWPWVLQLIFWRIGFTQYDAAKETTALGRLRGALDALERRLQGGRAWLATDDLSVADLAVASALVWAFKWVIDAELRKGLPNLTAWYLRVLGHDAAKDFFGEPEMVAVRQVPSE